MTANETENLQQVIARNVREYRRIRGLTLDALAAAAAISRRMLILIEGGATNPSVAVLDRLGQALGIGFPTLVGLPSQTGEGQVIAPEAMPLVWRGADPASVSRLVVATSPRGDVEMWDWRIAPGDAFAAGIEPPGTQKLVLVLDGVLTVPLADAPLRVPTGHSARFPADRPHGYENRDEGSLHFIATIVFGATVWGEA